LCFVTFTDHTAPVSALLFSSASKVLFSASLDGTARAYDMIRYRNFRTFQVPSTMQMPQFSSLAIDPSGEVLCVGSMSGSFDIYVFSVQTSRLLDVLSGHGAPVSSLSFSPISVCFYFLSSRDQLVFTTIIRDCWLRDHGIRRADCGISSIQRQQKKHSPIRLRF